MDKGQTDRREYDQVGSVYSDGVVPSGMLAYLHVQEGGVSQSQSEVSAGQQSQGAVIQKEAAHTAQVWTNRGIWTRGMVCYSYGSKVLVFDIMVPVSTIHIPS